MLYLQFGHWQCWLHFFNVDFLDQLTSSRMLSAYSWWCPQCSCSLFLWLGVTEARFENMNWRACKSRKSCWCGSVRTSLERVHFCCRNLSVYMFRLFFLCSRASVCALCRTVWADDVHQRTCSCQGVRVYEFVDGCVCMCAFVYVSIHMICTHTNAIVDAHIHIQMIYVYVAAGNRLNPSWENKRTPGRQKIIYWIN